MSSRHYQNGFRPVFAESFIAWVRAMWAKFMAYLARGGSDNEGQP